MHRRVTDDLREIGLKLSGTSYSVVEEGNDTQSRVPSYFGRY